MGAAATTSPPDTLVATRSGPCCRTPRSNSTLPSRSPGVTGVVIGAGLVFVGLRVLQEVINEPPESTAPRR